MSTTGANNQLPITNNTKVSLAVVDAVSQSPDASASQALVQVLKLLKTTAGAESIEEGKSASVSLNDTYIDSKTGKTQPSLLYRLIFSTTDWLVPVNIKGVMQDLITKKYKPVSVAESDRQAMVLADQFSTLIAAYPTSDLAKNFNAAVNASTNNASNAQSVDDVTKGVDDFFKGTKEYSTVTLDMVVAINSYRDTFPFVWARYENTMTYYLYSSDGTNPTKYQGQLSMTRSPSSTVPDVTRSDGGYKIVYTDASGKDIPLNYVKGQFLDNETVDIPHICVQGTFTLKSRLTGQASDNQIMSILTGSINGVTVLGIDTKQDSSNQRSFWQMLFDPQGAQEIFNSIMQIGGFLMLLHFAFTSLKSLKDWVREKWTGKKPANLEELIKQRTKEFQDAIKQNHDELFKKLTANRQQPPASDEAAEADLESSMERVSAWGEKAALDSGLEIEASRLEALAEALPDGPTAALEDAATRLSAIQDTLSNASPENITDVVQGQAAQLDGVRQTITTEQVNVEQQLSQEVQQDLAHQKLQSDAIEEDLAKIGEDSEAIKDGSIPEGEEAPEIPEVPLEV